MADQYKVDKGVPVPACQGGRISNYPWSEMGAGDSFEVPLADGDKIRRLQATLSRCALSKFGKGCIATRVNSDKTAVRVWRLK